MNIQKIMAFASFVLLGVTTYNVVTHMQMKAAEAEKKKIAAAEARAADPDKAIADSSAASTAPAVPPSAQRSLLSDGLGLMTGINLQIPKAQDYALVRKIPWERRDITMLYRDAGAEASCVLLDPGVELLQPLAKARKGEPSVLGRQPVFTIQLHPSADADQPLANATRGMIEDYLKSHQLTIEAQLYADALERAFVGPAVRAAFVAVADSKKTIPAEPMIQSSIAELRTVGAIWEGDAEFSPGACRTVLLGFRYTRDTAVKEEKGSAEREFELVFLHRLPDSSAADPKIVVFATANGRTEFHLLQPAALTAETQQTVTIQADVRFMDSKMMGMYPEAPVVTRVRHNSMMTISVDLVKAQYEKALVDKPGNGAFSSVLDDLYKQALELSVPEKKESAPVVEEK
ncbi:MAG: hypothetical protein JNM43_03850 [Planctomycetaceae bacterium]|nr:hypothetical protein [Planctomycetaceae bacterium]